ncbi:hypothetical protein [Persicitalea sp.]|uniref:hypothetical protein n=1 Tax=Persicitalea sp. TaxID=3100273 RepID=UPI003593A3FA
MKYNPVVLSYFSQSGDSDQQYLQFLENEYKSIGKAWEQYQIQQGSERYFEVEFPPRGSADGEEVAEDIRNYKHRILIFHFSGHADSERLLFKDGSSHASGLAGLLGEAQNLKLVFLNGCATYDQVKLLFDNNIKIVIATKGKVSDGIAQQFAETFYKALSDTDYTIRTAFEHALNELKRKYPNFDSVPAKPIVWRGLVTEAEEDRDRWQLYVKDKYQQEIDKREWWKIRLASPTRKDLLRGSSFWDQAMNFLILLLCLLGITIMVYAVFFMQDHMLAFVGLAAAFLAYFGFKNKQRYKTVEMNSTLADEEVMRRMKLFA